MRAAMVGVALLCLAIQGFAAEPKWDPIDATDLAAKDSTSKPGVDAEILFFRYDLDYAFGHFVVQRYVRAKIYTQKGVEEASKLNMESGVDSEIEAVASRVVKVNGTVINLKKTDFMESTVVKLGDFQKKQTAFAFPHLDVGDIVEYQWEESAKESNVYWYWTKILCQQVLPVREFTVVVESYPVAFSLLWFNCPGAELTRALAGDRVLTVRNLPPFEEEEDMPPERDYRAWAMIVGNNRYFENDEQWQRRSEHWDGEFDVSTSPGHSVKALASKLIAGSADETEKLRRLYEFCQKEIVNFNWNDAPEYREAKRKRGEKVNNQTPGATLENHSGTGVDIDYLFAGLARAAGFEVKLARSASRTELFNIEMPKGWIFLDRDSIAVRAGGHWQFHDPGQYWVPFGMLNWRDEGVKALLCDPKKVLFEDTPVSPAEMSQSRRKGRFTLDAAGTLEGTVEQAMTGHLAVDIKEGYWDKAADEIDRDWRKQVAVRLPTAELSDIRWENLRTFDFPVTVSYHVRVPGYAENAGSRLVLVPGFFAAGEPARFVKAERKYPVFFPRASADYDDIEIALPEGFEMERPGAPPNVGNPDTSIGVVFSMGYVPTKRLLVYKRHFALGANRALGCRPENYPGLKRLFEGIYKSDTHSIMLKRIDVGAGPRADAAAHNPQAATATAAP